MDSHGVVLIDGNDGLVAAVAFLFYLDILEGEVDRWYHMSEIITMLLSLSMTKRKVMTLAKARENRKRFFFWKKKKKGQCLGRSPELGLGENCKFWSQFFWFSSKTIIYISDNSYKIWVNYLCFLEEAKSIFSVRFSHSRADWLLYLWYNSKANPYLLSSVWTLLSLPNKEEPTRTECRRTSFWGELKNQNEEKKKNQGTASSLLVGQMCLNWLLKNSSMFWVHLMCFIEQRELC